MFTISAQFAKYLKERKRGYRHYHPPAPQALPQMANDPYGFKSAAKQAKHTTPTMHIPESMHAPPQQHSSTHTAAPNSSTPSNSNQLPFMPTTLSIAAHKSYHQQPDDELEANSAPVPTGGRTAAMNVASGSYDNEPPLLEELGIDVPQMRRKAMAMLLLHQRATSASSPLLEDEGDLSGPVMLAAALAALHVLLHGVVTLGPIVGWLALFMLGTYWLVNQLAAGHQHVGFYRCASIVGYSLVPVAFSSVLCLLLPSASAVKLLVLGFGALMSARCCARLLVTASPALLDAWFVLAVPCALVYSLFALLSY